ncbi:hypothetical protein J5N97_011987 [Dioscorea zingiberensis]|uniref:Uncharacterized protein n=1 Tax=Dioscorea zingiberensis TaxID=325984 RepID=A0A9D5CMY7_9LILI|nr:hypothetical protein J5N97_011987 [Dioscorea zingiberensis]
MAAAILRSLSSSAARRIVLLSRPIFSTISSKALFHRHRLSLPPSFRPISADVKHLPAFTDPDVEAAFKDLMAMSWDEIPDSAFASTKKALSKTTDDKAGQEALANVFRAAEASVEFGGVLVSLRMALDDLCGLTGENVDRLPDYLEDAMKAAYKRYMAYLDAFGPDEDDDQNMPLLGADRKESPPPPVIVHNEDEIQPVLVGVAGATAVADSDHSETPPADASWWRQPVLVGVAGATAVADSDHSETPPACWI